MLGTIFVPHVRNRTFTFSFVLTMAILAVATASCNGSGGSPGVAPATTAATTSTPMPNATPTTAPQSGTVVEFTPAIHRPFGITSGPDGNLWFVEAADGLTP